MSVFKVSQIFGSGRLRSHCFAIGAVGTAEVRRTKPPTSFVPDPSLCSATENLQFPARVSEQPYLCAKELCGRRHSVWAIALPRGLGRRCRAESRATTARPDHRRRHPRARLRDPSRGSWPELPACGRCVALRPRARGARNPIACSRGTHSPGRAPRRPMSVSGNQTYPNRRLATFGRRRR